MSSYSQVAVAEWLRRVFTPAELANVPERALRAVEEVIELAQACGVDRQAIYRLVDYVYERPVGQPGPEIAGSFVTLYAVAEALRLHADREFEQELERINQPEVITRVRRRQAEKREVTARPVQVRLGCSDVCGFALLVDRASVDITTTGSTNRRCDRCGAIMLVWGDG